MRQLPRRSFSDEQSRNTNCGDWRQSGPLGRFTKDRTEFTSPIIYGFDTPVPVPPNTFPLPVPTSDLDQQQLDLGWAHHNSGGGYKVPTLVGLYWSPPYLHDGGVAVGRNAASDLGLPGTVERNIAPDPANSLRAMLDRTLRAQVVISPTGFFKRLFGSSHFTSGYLRGFLAPALTHRV